MIKDLVKYKWSIAGIAVSLAAFLGWYFFIYGPFVKELNAARKSYQALTKELSWARQVTSSGQMPEIKEGPVSTADISLAIDELTKDGKRQGIDFISITPGQIRPKDEVYQIVPLEIESESTYEDLGTFLGSLDELAKSMVVVESLSIEIGRAHV